MNVRHVVRFYSFVPAVGRGPGMVSTLPDGMVRCVAIGESPSFTLYSRRSPNGIRQRECEAWSKTEQGPSNIPAGPGKAYRKQPEHKQGYQAKLPRESSSSSSSTSATQKKAKTKTRKAKTKTKKTAAPQPPPPPPRGNTDGGASWKRAKAASDSKPDSDDDTLGGFSSGPPQTKQQQQSNHQQLQQWQLQQQQYFLQQRYFQQHELVLSQHQHQQQQHQQLLQQLLHSNHHQQQQLANVEVWGGTGGVEGAGAGAGAMTADEPAPEGSVTAAILKNSLLFEGLASAAAEMEVEEIGGFSIVSSASDLKHTACGLLQQGAPTS